MLNPTCPPQRFRTPKVKFKNSKSQNSLMKKLYAQNGQTYHMNIKISYQKVQFRTLDPESQKHYWHIGISPTWKFCESDARQIFKELIFLFCDRIFNFSILLHVSPAVVDKPCHIRLHRPCRRGWWRAIRGNCGKVLIGLAWSALEMS